MASTTPVAPPGLFPAPPGITPNYINPEKRTLGLIPLICVFLPLSTICLLLRLYTKARIIKLLGWEDVAITLGWVFNVTFMAFLIVAVKLGNGAHIWNVTKANYLEFTKTLSAGVIIYVPAVALPKVAILLFYLRLNPSKSFRYSCIAVTAITLAYMLALMLALLFPCHPIKKLWDPLTPGHCLDQNKTYLANPIINTAVDVLVLVLPIPMLITLRVNARTKLVLASIFAICSATVVISAVRIWATVKILGDADFTWNTALSDALAVCELNLTIVCGSVLTLRPFCRRHLPMLLGGRKTRPEGNEERGAAGNNAEIGQLHFDGPMGPRSKSAYRAKVIGGRGRGGGGYGGSKRSGGKRSLWSGFGSTLVTEDDDDLEGLSAELREVAPHVRVGGRGGRGDRGGDDVGGREKSWKPFQPAHLGEGRVGVPKEDASGVYTQSREDVEHGIVKTMSLDVR